MFDNFFKRYKYANTRQFLRIQAPWPLKYQLSTEADNPRVTLAKDVSAGGLGVVVQERIPVGSQIQVEIHVPPLSRTLSAEGQVVRTGAQGDSFELGVRFVQMNPEDRQALDEAIEKFYSPKERARQQGTRWRRLP